MHLLHDIFILFAYFAMVLTPCVVAQWGDAINLDWLFRQGSVQAVAQQQVPAVAQSYVLRPRRFASAAALQATMLQPSSTLLPNTPAVMEARRRVAMRLKQLSEAHHAAAAAKAAEPTRPEVHTTIHATVQSRGYSSEFEMLQRISTRDPLNAGPPGMPELVPDAGRAEDAEHETRGAPRLSVAA